ncbi:serine acetyltransferase [Tribonema minus]|uniref:Serine acetyltransferase n=1 Tax=Tribonema minus TaxID=303371 RepID=A0A835ZGB2_9STRA|nr:serine acetyltransferase [Tribonema minus]
MDLRGNTAVALWTVICVEGRVACAQDQDISAMLHSNVLSHDRLADAVTVLLANKLATPFIGAMEVGTIMTEMFEADPEVEEIMAADILAHALRDSDDGTDLLSVLLFHKGFHALATYRLAHWLWQQGRRQLARFFQSVNSEVCAADIHPASRIGRGIFLASGCDVVIGETAVVGNNVIIHSGVTLGGTGKERGDRHPKVADGVQIGVSASVLGNIKVGEGAHVGSCSVVVKEILPYTANKGVPSKLAGWLVCDVEAGGNLVAGQHPMMVVEATKK